MRLRWRPIGFAVLAAVASASAAAIGGPQSGGAVSVTAPAPPFDASRWTAVGDAADANSLLTGLATFVHAAAAADHLGEPARSRVAGVAGERWSSFALIPDNPRLNRVLISLGTIVGFDAAVYRAGGLVIVAFAGSGPFVSSAGISDWLIADGSNAVIGLLNRIAGPTSLSSDAVYQYGLGKLLVQAVQRQLKPCDKLYLAGHSLGGGIAALAGGQMSIPTVTFNTASITLAAGAAFDPGYVLNLQIENDLAAFGGQIEGVSVVFASDSAVMKRPDVPWDRHDMVIFEYLLEAAKQGRLRFTGFAGETPPSWTTRRGGATYFVGGS